MENRGLWYHCIQNVFKNILSKIQVSEMGIPFCKTQGFPNCPPAMSQIRSPSPKRLF